MNQQATKANRSIPWRRRMNSSAKSLTIMIVITITMLLGSLVINSIYLGRMNQSALSNYNESLSSSLSFWDARFETINASLLQIADPENEAYFYVASSLDPFTASINRTKLQKQLDYYARSQQYVFHYFSYFPEQSLLIESRNYIKEHAKRQNINQTIQSYVLAQEQPRYSNWRLINAADHPCLLSYFYVQDNYIGAFIELDTLIDQIKQTYSVPVQILLLDSGNTPVFASPEVTPAGSRELAFDHTIDNLDYNIRIILPRSFVYRDQVSIFAAGALLVWIGAFLLFFNIRYHVRHVLIPLEKLKAGMLAFSNGDTDVRLRLDSTVNDKEISSLYEVFNGMVEQITSLKIQVYEQELENRRIESDYILTRIQPHFYANILNLILFLAQVKDYENIQKLSYAAGTYFRYLLGEKGTFVKLSDELNCVNAYIDVQHIRYQGMFEYSYSSEVDEEKCIVLPMLLQTFIGNSIKHNVTFVPVLHIAVRTSVADDILTIEIQDDGVGFAPETLEKINRDEPIEKNGHHIGIQNIKARIKMFYQDNGSINIQSRPGETLVTIKLPYLSEEAMKR